MSLAQILYPPPTKTGLGEWLWANYQHHLAVNGAVFTKSSDRLTLYRIWPVGDADFNGWLEQHQQQHNVTNEALGTSGFDLSSVDIKNKKQFDAFVWIHFIEHRNWAQTLGLTI